MNAAPSLPSPVVTGADLGPEHQGCYVQINTVVTEENEAKGLGPLGKQVTVRGTIYHAARHTRLITNYRITSLILRVSGFSDLLSFNLGDRDPAEILTEG